MKRPALLVALAVSSLLLASLLVFIFNDSKPQFLSGIEGEVELVNSNFFAPTGSSDTFIMREWRVWPKSAEDLFAEARHEFSKSYGWAELSGKASGTQWLQLTSPSASVTILFEEGDWRVYETRKVSKLEYCKAWLRSGGKVTLTSPTINIGGASPKAGSPSKSP